MDCTYIELTTIGFPHFSTGETTITTAYSVKSSEIAFPSTFSEVPITTTEIIQLTEATELTERTRELINTTQDIWKTGYSSPTTPTSITYETKITTSATTTAFGQENISLYTEFVETMTSATTVGVSTAILPTDFTPNPEEITKGSFSIPTFSVETITSIMQSPETIPTSTPSELQTEYVSYTPLQNVTQFSLPTATSTMKKTYSSKIPVTEMTEHTVTEETFPTTFSEIENITKITWSPTTFHFSPTTTSIFPTVPIFSTEMTLEARTQEEPTSTFSIDTRTDDEILRECLPGRPCNEEEKCISTSEDFKVH